MKLPAYGRSLWQRRLLGERVRVVCLLVGDRWKLPRWLPAVTPRIAVKTAPWHTLAAERFDWRLVVDCTVLAVDQRGPDERMDGPDGWDPWFWLLADVQRYARDVLLFTPTENFVDPPDRFAPERCLEVYAWCARRYVDGVETWPAWWPFGDEIFRRGDQPVGAWNEQRCA